MFVGGLVLFVAAIVLVRSWLRVVNLEIRDGAGNRQVNEERPFAWPQWLGPARNGVSTETGLLAEWPASGPVMVWEAPLGPGYSSTAVARGRALTMAYVEGREVVVCFNADTGKIIWRRSYACAYEGMDPRFDDGPRSTPTIDGECVYTVGATGIFICWNLIDGSEIWRHDLQEEFQAKPLYWGVSFSPLIVGDLVIACPGGQTGSRAAFEKGSGKLVWSTGSGPASYSSPILIRAAGQDQLVFFESNRLVGASPVDGRELWSFPWETDYDLNIATPLFIDGDLFISSGYGRGCARIRIRTDGKALRAELVYKNKKLSNQFTNSVFHNGQLFGFDRSDGHFVCLDYGTGQVRWKEARLGLGSILVADDKLFLVHADGTLALAEATAVGYQEKSRYEFSTRNQVWAAPALANGRLFVRDGARLVCFQVKAGSE